MNVKATVLSRVPSELLSKGSSSNYLIFPFFIILNLFTYTDRGIIPGASREFSSFAANANDTPDFLGNNPDAGLGILQAGFVFGYSIAIIICGHYVHLVPWKYMIMMGLSSWIAAVFLSALSHSFNSYFMLFTARMITGISEASFQVIAPPMFQDRGGKRAGLWLSLFLSAMPLGMALGYILGSQVANAEGLGWQWAFLIEGFLAFGLLFVGFFIKDKKNGGVFAPHQVDPVGETPKLSFLQEIRICLASKPLLAIMAAQSIGIAIFAVLSTFGGAFLLALGLYESETEGAANFAVTAAVGGAVGTPIGGIILDKVLYKYRNRDYDPEKEDKEIDPNLSRIHYLEQLKALLPVTTIIVAIGIVICYPTLFVKNPRVFLSFFFFGWMFLFAAQAGIIMSVMLSVPASHRSNAIAFSTLMAHVLGDVPSPVIFGIIKDKLAPACVVAANGEFVDAERCQFQHIGIRSTIGIAYAWITLSVIFFEWARRLVIKELKELYKISGDQEFGLGDKKRVVEGSLFPVKNIGIDNAGKNDFEVIDISSNGGIL